MHRELPFAQVQLDAVVVLGHVDLGDVDVAHRAVGAHRQHHLRPVAPLLGHQHGEGVVERRGVGELPPRGVLVAALDGVVLARQGGAVGELGLAGGELGGLPRDDRLQGLPAGRGLGPHLDQLDLGLGRRHLADRRRPGRRRGGRGRGGRGRGGGGGGSSARVGERAGPPGRGRRRVHRSRATSLRALAPGRLGRSRWSAPGPLGGVRRRARSSGRCRRGAMGRVLGCGARSPPHHEGIPGGGAGRSARWCPV